MISRIVVAAVLAAGTLALTGPTYAQTGVSGQAAVNSGAGSQNGSVGTTSNTPRNNSSSTSTTMGPMGGGSTNSPGMGGNGAMSAQASMNGQGATGMHMQGGMDRQGMRGDAAERRMTECLNGAAAQHRPLDGCRR